MPSFNNSAAAFKSGSRRGWVLLGVVLLVLGASMAARGPATATSTPLVQVTPNELRLSQPLAEAGLAAEDGRAAFAFCHQLVGVWRPGATAITRLGSVAQWTCPPPIGLETIFSLAFAGDRVAWSARAGGNQVTNLLFLVVLGQPHVRTIAAEYTYCCAGSDPDPNRMGDVYGDANFIAFSSRVKCNDLGVPGCPGATRTLISQSIWRLLRPPFRAICVGGQVGPCLPLAILNEALQPLSVDSGRVAARRTRGRLVILNSSGRLLRELRPVPDVDPAVELMGGRAVVLTPGKLQVYSISSGALLISRPMPNVPTGGVCGMPPCPPATLRLVDAARGLVAYILSANLHLLRLRDGKDRVVAAATDARFGDTGLFYSYTAAAPWVSRIRFKPWQTLPVQP